MVRRIVPHLDDLGCSLGVNEAMLELTALGVVTSGSAMVPTPWFPDVVARMSDLDVGVHLTLNAESAAVRWRPVSTTDPASGLLDPGGYLWGTVQELRDHADPEAVEGEMRQQVEVALASGLRTTHLDHHMGAALFPEFVERTVDMAIDHNLPMLFPLDLDDYFDALDKGSSDLKTVTAARRRAERAGVAFGDRFVMPLDEERTDHEPALKRAFAEAIDGTTYLSLHCSTPGEIMSIHPNDGRWRIGEWDVMSDPSFASWVADQDVEVIGMASG